MYSPIGSFPDAQLPSKRIIGPKNYEFLTSKRQDFQEYLQVTKIESVQQDHRLVKIYTKIYIVTRPVTQKYRCHVKYYKYQRIFAIAATTYTHAILERPTERAIALLVTANKRKRGFMFLSILQKLLQHPELSNSQLLADFLSPHSMESQFLDKMLPDVNLGRT